MIFKKCVGLLLVTGSDRSALPLHGCQPAILKKRNSVRAHTPRNRFASDRSWASPAVLCSCIPPWSNDCSV